MRVIKKYLKKDGMYSCGMYNTNCQIKFKTLMFGSSLCDCSDAYILVKGTISIKRVPAPVEEDNDGKELEFNNY